MGNPVSRVITVTTVIDGTNGDTPVQLFKWFGSNETVSKPTVTKEQWDTGTSQSLGGWSKTAPNKEADKDLYMSQNVLKGDGTLNSGEWSTPVRISGEDGDPGADSKEREWIYIGKSELTTFGNAQSANPKPSVITKDAGGTTRDHDTYIIKTDDFVPYGWSDNAIAVDDTTNIYVYASWRDWNKDTETWSDFRDPILWSNWGHQGIDGDGVQYVYKLFDHELTDAERTSNIPTKPASMTQGEWVPTGWSDDPLAPTSSDKFCYCSIIKKIGGSWADNFEKLGLWSKWSKDGLNVPSYIETQEAWSNDTETTNATTSPTTDYNAAEGQPGSAGYPKDSDWYPYTPANTNYAYLWRRSRQMTLNQDGTSYTAGTWTYVRLSGTNGTSISVKGKVVSVKTASSGFPTTGVSANDLAIVKTQAKLYKYSGSAWAQNGPTASDGDSYTNEDDHHLWMWSTEANNGNGEWLDLGEFKGENGVTYYTHIAWASSVDTTHPWSGSLPAGQISTPTVASASDVTGGSIAPASDGSKPWMGVLINTSSGPDTTHWHYYTWSNTKGAKGDSAVRLALDNEHEDFLYSDAGLVAPSGGATSEYHLYDGITEKRSELTSQTLSVDYTKSSGIPSASETGHPTIDSTNYRLTVPKITADTAKVVLKATYGDTEYFAAFTANKKKQDKYDLVITPNAIPYNSSNTWTNKAITVKASRTDISGAHTDNISFVANGLYVFANFSKEIKAFVSRAGRDDSYWNNSSWTDIGDSTGDFEGTSTIRGNCYENDYFIVYGTTTDTNKFYVLVVKCSNNSGNLAGTVVARQVASGITTTITIGKTVADDNEGIFIQLRKAVGTYTPGTASTYSVEDYETIEIAKVQNGADSTVPGQPGSDAINVLVEPSAIIVNQDLNSPDNLSNLSGDTAARSLITVVKGNTQIPVTLVENNGMSHCTASVGVTSDTVAKGYVQLTSVLTSSGAYYNSGYVNVSVTYNDNGTSKTISGIKINFYANLLGTWAADVQQDAIYEAGRKIETELGPNGAITSAYEGAIERSAKGLTQMFKEETGRPDSGNKNLFGFHKGCAMTNSAWPCVPFIQGYGIVINSNYSGGRRARIANMGFGGEGGSFVVSFSARLQSGNAYTIYKINVNLCDVNGTVLTSPESTDVGTDKIKLTTSWGNYEILYNIPSDNISLLDHSDILDFEDLEGNITGNIYIRHLKVERGEEATAFCEADEDIAYIGQENKIQAWAYNQDFIIMGTVDGYSNVYYTPSVLYPGNWPDGEFYNLIYKNSVGFYLESGKIYTLSFWAKCSSDKFIIQQYLYGDAAIITNVEVSIYDPNTSSGDLIEGVKSDGETRIRLSTSWKQYFVRFYVSANIYSVNAIALRVSKDINAYTSYYGTSYYSSRVYMRDIRMQEGYVMDENTFRSLVEQNARRISLMQYTGARAAGMDIQNGVVDLIADRVTFSNSARTVTGKIWIDPTTGALHAVDGYFSGNVTATGGSIGGFGIDSDRLYNSNWEAGIDITYDSKNVKIGKNAQGEQVSGDQKEQAIIRAENTKTGQTYNTALYLNAKNATYNYAFYGNGNGVLNGLVVGYKVGTVQTSGSGDKDYDIKLTDGTTIFIIGNQSSGHARVWMPKLSHVRQALGLKASDTTTPFAVEISIINLSTYEYVSVHFRHNSNSSQNEYPWHMSYDNVMATEDISLISEYTSKQLAGGDYIKILLVYYNGLYRAEVLRSLDGGWGY